jgi:UDP-glucose 4-epimerase
MTVVKRELSLPSQRIAVTGATGFLGRRLVQALLAQNMEVLALVRDPRRARRDLEALDDSRIEVVEFDLGGSLDCAKLSGVATLVHAAAYIPTSFDEPDEAEACLDANALGTLRVLRSAVLAGVPYVVYLSAGNAYATGERSAQEGDALYPSGRAPYYLMSKVAGEVYADHLRQKKCFRLAVLRPSGLYGPGMSSRGLVSTFLVQAAAGQPLIVGDGGRYFVDLVHVDDVVDAIVTCVRTQVIGVYNLGSGRSTSTLELASCLVEMAGLSKSQVVVEGAVEGPRLGFAPLDIRRAREVLNFSPRGLRAGLLPLLQSSPK